MPTFTVYKGSESGAAVKSTTTKPDELTGDLVFLRVTASGVCGTDLHYKHTDMALGHEGIGVVEATGPLCKFLKKGDRVGWGYEHDSCGNCRSCLTGMEQYCKGRELYGLSNLDQGSFASHAVWREAYLFKIPDTISDEVAAPFMCGGATVFEAMMAYDSRPTDVMGIIGVGGLGHLAIQFCNAMGAHVIVLSGSERKKDEALSLGAHEFIAIKGKTSIEPSRLINRLFVTTSAQPDWALLAPILAPGATVYPLSVAGGNFVFPYVPLLLQGITIQGSLVASRHTQNDMLEFVALHGIKPVIQKFPMTEEGVNDALTKLDKGEVHFRAVLIPEEE
ncbi:hypothetical protein VPNG_10320 [Cytospora leucostoma]|uniref:Enoyl reductase (ER) domain-containing protein n=1 Tax=Cytospora leucostoma TaxID=1230097 RepID=A0A423VBA0_9PEZI|nr:hypothetical protein VPNG_10320 [Cytospora leucostoma]